MRRQEGFTLIEIIMIIIIVAIAIPALLIMMGQEARQGVDAELRITASNLGQALMEEILSKGWSGADSYNGNNYPLTISPTTYNRQVSICNVPEADLNDTSNCTQNTAYKRITITVDAPPSWGTGQLGLVTLVTNY